MHDKCYDILIDGSTVRLRAGKLPSRKTVAALHDIVRAAADVQSEIERKAKDSGPKTFDKRMQGRIRRAVQNSIGTSSVSSRS